MNLKKVEGECVFLIRNIYNAKWIFVFKVLKIKYENFVIVYVLKEMMGYLMCAYTSTLYI